MPFPVTVLPEDTRRKSMRVVAAAAAASIVVLSCLAYLSTLHSDGMDHKRRNHILRTRRDDESKPQIQIQHKREQMGIVIDGSGLLFEDDFSDCQVTKSNPSTPPREGGATPCLSLTTALICSDLRRR